MDKLTRLDQKIRRCTCGAQVYNAQYCKYPHNYNERAGSGR